MEIDDADNRLPRTRLPKLNGGAYKPQQELSTGGVDKYLQYGMSHIVEVGAYSERTNNKGLARFLK